ncbi:MAG: anaerobic sulfatase maturase [Kiritimatiellia bacterium]|nr:anaerobic sulfatase maturase [Kiritimatiellia bacterium]MDP6848343.1 anaerobic sulfatase maturase [Kiritimatiellia bacterium]
MKPFSLLVKPASADCNLRCRYCFYLDRCELYPGTRRHRMSDEVLETMIQTYLGTDQPQYSIGWQGGEPTMMGLDFFKKVTSLQEKHGRRGAAVSNGLQTNTTLINDEWAQHLARYNFLVGVSIDGPPEIHDKYRVFVDGRGAHSAVMKGLESLKRNHVEYNVLTLVSESNFAKPREVYHYLRDDLGVMFHQYIECVEFDSDGDLMPFAINGGQWGEFLCAIYDEWIACEDTHRVSVRLFDSLLTMMVDGYANVCAMGQDCRQYLVVEHNGDIYPCDFYVRPDLKLGNIMENSWEELLESTAYREFGVRKSQWNEKCAECKYLKFCSGCCPKNRPLQGKDPTKLSVLCEGWLQFFDHAMPGIESLADGIRREREHAEAAARRERIASMNLGRLGRNDPCPCGSGKKFKKCCGKG